MDTAISGLQERSRQKIADCISLLVDSRENGSKFLEQMFVVTLRGIKLTLWTPALVPEKVSFKQKKSLLYSGSGVVGAQQELEEMT